MSAPPEVEVALDARQREAFVTQADRLGHDAAALLAGRTVTTYPTIPSVAAARRLLPATAEQRVRRQAGFFSPDIALRRSIGQGVHDRLEAAVFADGTVDAGDEAGAARHFPFPAKATSMLSLRVGAEQCWDLSVRGVEFGVDDFDDLLVLVNVGELVLEPGAAVIVRGNLLALVVQRLVCLAAPTDPDGFHLGILPTPFSVDPRRDRVQAAAGRPGLDGMAGSDGVAAPTQPTFVGPRLVPMVDPPGSDGRRGTDGRPGTDGASGASGGPSKLADVTIGEIAADRLVLCAAAGAGLSGGAGGAGGRGGAGGAGAPAVRAVGQYVPAGRGGNGGNGSDGGRGGRGGSGGISSNVFVTVPPEQAQRVRVVAVGSRGGRGGSGGAAGTGGAGGIGEPPGHAGKAGRDGSPGGDGRARPAPPVFVNEEPWRDA